MLRMISLLGCLLLLTISLGVPSALAINEILIINNHGDYMKVADSDSLDITGEVTIEARVRLHDDKNQTFFRKESAYLLEIEGTRPWLVVWSDEESGWRNIAILPFDLEVGTSYHIAAVYNQEVGQIFINGELGVEENLSGYTGNIAASPNDLLIGYWGEPFVGRIDEARIWNIARTQTEIQDNMNQPLANPQSMDNLVGYWNFDGGATDDLSQYENHGSLKGDAYIADVIYVSPDGSPTGDGTKENPYDTIQRGIDESGRKDIVQALPGVYEENIELLSDLMVFGSGAENTTITAASGNIVTANNLHNITLSGFTIDGQGSADNGILCSGTTSEMEIKANVVTGTSIAGIGCGGFANVIIDDNSIKANAESGIVCNENAKVEIVNNDICNNHLGVYCYNTAEVVIQYNFISQNLAHGVHCENSSTVTCISNTIQRHGYHGIWCAHNSKVNIADNLIHSNRDYGIVLWDLSNTTIIRNIIRNHNGAIHCYGSIRTIIGGKLTDANNITANRSVAIMNWASTTINAAYNYWGTTNESEIAAMMKNKGEGSIIFKPFINTLDEIIADVSGDGTISALDAALILQYVIGLIDKFPATNPISQAGQKYISGKITIDELDRILQKWGYPSVFKLLGIENQLLQNYPNPFNPDTWIPFKLARNAPVAICIYDTKGQLVRTLHIGNKGAGIYVTKDKAAYWDGRCRYGEKVVSGVYFYHLKAGDFSATRRMLIVK